MTAGGEQVVDPGAVLDLLGERAALEAEREGADRRSAAGDDLVEEAPAVELHDATPGEGMGREGVARQLGAVDDDDVESLAGEQHRRRGAGGAGADDDDIGLVGGGGGVVRIHADTFREPGPPHLERT